MTALRKLLAGAAALGVVLAAAPAGAQGWYGDGYRHGWRDRPGWAYGGRPYGDYEGGPYGNYGGDAGEMDIAICPPGYRLGRSARLCWPD
jgi:hypothetical protein